MRKMGRALSESEEAYARDNGVFYKEDPKPIEGGFDRSGFDLTPENGLMVHPTVTPGVPYTFTFPRNTGGTIRVFGVGGDQINKVNGRGVIKDTSLPAVGGAISLTVEGVGLNGQIRLGVQLVP